MIARSLIVLVVLWTGGAAIANPPPEPTLDELLGLPKQPDRATPALPDPSRTELDARLNPEEVSDEFAQAVGLMRQTSDRLTQAKDVGIATQRLQEDTLRKLDKLIDQARQNQSSSKSKSKKKPKPGDEQSQQQQAQSSQASQPAPSAQDGAPSVARQDGALNPPPPSSAASWGALPEHMRQALSQGLSDRFSSMYQQLTQQYYKRLAEEPKPASGRP